MDESELEARCHARAAHNGGQFILRSTAGGGGYEALIIFPPGVDPDSLEVERMEGYEDNTRWGAMRRLLNEPGARAEPRR